MDQPTTVADTMLGIFRAYGVQYIFSSPGSEWTPLWESLARAKLEGNGPTFLNTRHELLAVSLAIGHYRQSLKLPIIVLHATVGPLNAAMALRTARHERIPMVVLAGESASYGEAAGPDAGHLWASHLSDTGGASGLVGPYVKRSSAVTCREVFPGMLQDACRIALTPPYGPVFLSVPQEFMDGPTPMRELRCTPPPAPTRAPAEETELVARELVRAERPVLVTEYAGRNPRNVDLLVELAETLAMPVVEASSPAFMNFPRDHALHQGFDAGELVRQADMVLLVGAQPPWHPSSRGPQNARVILIDDDPSQELLHYWGYGVDHVVGGDLTHSLQQVNAHVKRLSAESDGEARRQRWAVWKNKHLQQHEEWRAQALQAAEHRPIDSHWAMLTLADTLPDEAIVVPEVITQKVPLLRHLRTNTAGTYQARTTGGLGVGLGVALGLKLAAPDRFVVAIEGDGSFNYNPVLAAFGFAQQLATPILVVIMNNHGYAAMKRAHLGRYPAGWSVRTDTFFGAEIEPAPDYVAIAQAFGGYGERVEDPLLLSDALRRSVERVEGGKLALVDVNVDVPRSS